MKTAPLTANPTLRTLAENKTDGVSKSTTFRVDPNLIKFERGFNLRTDGPELEEHIERLYQAYKAGDQLPAIDAVVDENGTVIARDGHCRTKAAKKLRREIPDFTIEVRQFRGNDADALIHMLNTGTGGMKLTPLQEGIGYLRLLKMGKTVIEIAEARHVSRVTVDNGITLAEAPAEVQKMITDGKVSATTARDAVKGGKDAVAALKAKVEESDAQPELPLKPGKPEKKKKVTAKSLRGTAAEKKPKAKKAKVASDEIALPPVKKWVARIIADALVGETDAEVVSFVAAIETELL